MAITAETIAVNRYAPDGSEAINLYSTGAADSLTLGQLAIAVSCRVAAACEAQSVLKMNTMTAGSQVLDDAAAVLEQVAKGTADWTQAKTFITERLGIDANSLPDGIDTYAKRIQAAEAMKNKMDTLAQSQQRDMIDLQTLVNRRDVAYSTSSNIVRTLGGSQAGNAANF